LRFKKNDRYNLLDILDKDVKLLQGHNIMDYSLLFAVEKNTNFKGGKSTATRTITSDDNDENQTKCKSFE
jgi:hypothetical protein